MIISLRWTVICAQTEHGYPWSVRYQTDTVSRCRSIIQNYWIHSVMTGQRCFNSRSKKFPKNKKAFTDIEVCQWMLFWRRRRDSNPRAPEGKRISSAPRYDHFDTSPFSMAAETCRRHIAKFPQLVYYIRLCDKRKALNWKNIMMTEENDTAILQ